MPVLQTPDLEIGANERLVDEGDVLRDHLDALIAPPRQQESSPDEWSPSLTLTEYLFL